MNIIKKHNILKSRRRAFKVRTIVLHHSAGPSVRSAENALINRNLGYHFMIEKDGTVYEYAPVHRYMSHAYRYNRGSAGVCFIGGGKYGPASECQIEAVIEVLRMLAFDFPAITTVTGHKHVDRRGPHLRRGKIDPRFEGEPEQSIDWKIDEKFMKRIANQSGLRFVNRKELYGTWE